MTKRLKSLHRCLQCFTLYPPFYHKLSCCQFPCWLIVIWLSASMHRSLYHSTHCLFPWLIPLWSIELRISGHFSADLLFFFFSKVQCGQLQTVPIVTTSSCCCSSLFAVIHWPNNQCHQVDQECIVETAGSALGRLCFVVVSALHIIERVDNMHLEACWFATAL